jgi:hypothetical protein
MSIEYFDTSKIRKNKSHLGKKRGYSLTLSEDTHSALEHYVHKGTGLYGSAVIELSTRLMIALVSEDPTMVESVFEELVDGIKSPYFARNLNKLYKMYMQ